MSKSDNTLHIYTRVSTSVQENEGTSLDYQKDIGIKQSENLGFEYKLWNEGGQSSFHYDLDNRPVLVSLLSGVEDGLIKNVFVYNTDRLSRNHKTWGIIRYKFVQNGVKLYTETGIMDLSNPTDDLFLGLLSEFSQYENRIRSERSRRGRFIKIQQGHWRGGPTPFGYKNDNKKLVIDENESSWIKDIYNMYSSGKSINEIRQKLVLNSVQTRRKKPSWSTGSINKILKNTVYIGHYNYTDKLVGETIKVPTPPIIDEITFNTVQRRFKTVNERKNQINRSKHFYLLRDFLKCGHCGKNMSGRKDPNRHHEHYYCPRKETNWKNGFNNDVKWKRGKGCSMIRSLNIQSTDEIVWKTVLNIVNDSKILREEYRSVVVPEIIENREDGKTTITKFKSKIKRHQRDLKRIDKTISDFETEILLKKNKGNPDLIRPNLQNEKQSITDKLDKTNLDYKSFLKEKSWVDWLRTYQSDVDERETTLSDQEKYQYLSNLLDDIKVNFDHDNNCHSLDINFNIPIVNDFLKYNNPKNRTDGWSVEDGELSFRVENLQINNGGRPSKKNVS